MMILSYLIRFQKITSITTLILPTLYLFKNSKVSTKLGNFFFPICFPLRGVTSCKLGEIYHENTTIYLTRSS